VSEGPALEGNDIERLMSGQRDVEESLTLATAPALKVLANEQTEIATVRTTRRERERQGRREEG